MTSKPNTIVVENGQGATFNVLLISPGERSAYNPESINSSGSPYVEIFDANASGQSAYVGRYTPKMFSQFTMGFVLNCSSPTWVLSAANVASINEALFGNSAPAGVGHSNHNVQLLNKLTSKLNEIMIDAGLIEAGTTVSSPRALELCSDLHAMVKSYGQSDDQQKFLALITYSTTNADMSLDSSGTELMSHVSLTELSDLVAAYDLKHSSAAYFDDRSTLSFYTEPQPRNLGSIIYGLNVTRSDGLPLPLHEAEKLTRILGIQCETLNPKIHNAN